MLTTQRATGGAPTSNLHPSTLDRILDPKKAPANQHLIEKLTDAAERLSQSPVNETAYELSRRLEQLQQLHLRIEQEALNMLEAQMVEGLGDTEGITREALSTWAHNPLIPNSIRIAFDYLLNNQPMLNALNTRSQQSNSQSSSSEFAITMADIQARQFSINNDIPEHTEVLDTTKQYQVPTSDHTYVTGGLDTPNRSATLYSNQQNAVEFAIRAGITTSFRNSDGNTHSVVISPLHFKGAARYRVSLDGDTQFDVHSFISTSRTIEAISNIIEWGTTFEAREGIREFPALVILNNQSHSAGSAAASYLGQTHTMTFYAGHRYISEANYNHEMAHGIGWQLDQTESDTRQCFESGNIRHDYTPNGWQTITDTAKKEGINPMTRYAETEPAEDFAESLSAYMHARDHSATGLSKLHHAYPHRLKYLETHIFPRRITDKP